MPATPIPHTSVMEGRGAYNEHSANPAAGGALALHPLETAARAVPFGAKDSPVVIADYGSSQGRNSLAPMRAAISALRERVGAHRPIVVTHTDLPGNEFSTLFELLETDPGSYTRGQANVFPYAIGRSFYQSVFPPGHVDLGWSSYAAVWLSQVPSPIPGHIFIPCCTGALRAEFDRQAARDWELFLELRSLELRPGGRLVVSLPSLDHDGSTTVANIMDHANGVLSQMVDEGLITAGERGRMTLAACLRRERDLLAPFAASGTFHGLSVEYCRTTNVPDVEWPDYERSGDAAALAGKHALFFRAIFMPALLKALDPGRGPEGHHAFAAQLEQGMRLRIAQNPVRNDHMLAVIVLKKHGSIMGG